MILSRPGPWPSAVRLSTAFALFCAAALGTPARARGDGGVSQPMANWQAYATAKADRIVVYKSKRRMELWRGNRILRTYHVSLGRHPAGQKTEQGDGRTPEGVYVIDHRKMSEYHLALHISYPDGDDIRRAEAEGVSPGGSIMIHGQPDYLTPAERKELAKDWTAGCIALTDPEIDEVWRLVDDGVPVEINP